VNLRQDDWSATKAVKGSILFGAADDIATWLPPTLDRFLFTISGSIAANADRTRAGTPRSWTGSRPFAIGRPPGRGLCEAKAAVTRAVTDDVPDDRGTPLINSRSSKASARSTICSICRGSSQP
jgi:hypothetical protein